MVTFEEYSAALSNGLLEYVKFERFTGTDTSTAEAGATSTDGHPRTSTTDINEPAKTSTSNGSTEPIPSAFTERLVSSNSMKAVGAMEADRQVNRPGPCTQSRPFHPPPFRPKSAGPVGSGRPPRWDPVSRIYLYEDVYGPPLPGSGLDGLVSSMGGMGISSNASEGFFGAPPRQKEQSAAKRPAEGLFGNTSAVQQPPVQQEKGLFGATAVPSRQQQPSIHGSSRGLFGTELPAAQQPPSGGLFGAAPVQHAPQQSARTGPASSLFGNAVSPVQQASPRGPFGASPNQQAQQSLALQGVGLSGSTASTNQQPPAQTIKEEKKKEEDKEEVQPKKRGKKATVEDA